MKCRIRCSFFCSDEVVTQTYSHRETLEEEFGTLEEKFRAAMGSVAAPVSVVTTFDGDVPHGTTVSAFSSLSMKPAMMLVSLDRNSRLLTQLSVDSVVGVNVLSDVQEEIAARFATRDDDKFRGLDWNARDAAPALRGVHAWVSMRAAQFHRAGDHVVVFGHVIGAEVQPNRPLTYWRRTFGTHHPAT